MSDLARACRVPPSSMSEHLAVLERAGMIKGARLGRFRYFTLASEHVAHLLEVAGLISAPRPVRSLSESEQARLERAARFCWKHLAGDLGVRLRDLLVQAHALDAVGDEAVVTPLGTSFLHDAFDVDARSGTIVRSCVDATERRLHASGSIAVAIARTFVERGWLRHGPGRAALLTPEGKERFDALAAVST
jgi:ribosomal protein S19E (S16A)